MDPANLDIPEPLQKKEKGKGSTILAIVHIRTSKVKESSKGPLVCPTLAGLTSQTQTLTQTGAGAGAGAGQLINWDGLRDGFVEHLHGLNSTIWYSVWCGVACGL